MSTPFQFPTHNLKESMLRSLESECAERYSTSMRMLDEIRVEVRLLKVQRAALREVAVRAAETFRSYAEVHAAKHTPDGDAKAARDRNLAISIETLLKEIP